VTSPNYDGLCADLVGIKKIIGDRIFVVDEAHGGAGYFNADMKVNAMNAGADMSIISTHKSLGGMNGSAILLTSKTSKISHKKVLNAYRCLATSSRSWNSYADLEGLVCKMVESGKKMFANAKLRV